MTTPSRHSESWWKGLVHLSMAMDWLIDKFLQKFVYLSYDALKFDSMSRSRDHHLPCFTSVAYCYYIRNFQRLGSTHMHITHDTYTTLGKLLIQQDIKESLNSQKRGLPGCYTQNYNWNATLSSLQTLYFDGSVCKDDFNSIAKACKV